ncbi:hypothetical protein KY314_03295, partial [Candidatus Woesearchaeota archaeon]|nr:hypothetical protein [Candidatus Woesearchaeota archaeon]
KEIMQGKEVAVGIPVYNDVWKLREDDSPLKEYVLDEHIKDAVNTGFWSCLKSNNFYSNEILDKILDFDYFFDFFEFDKGAEKAEKLPDNIRFEKFKGLYKYMRWYLAQEVSIFQKFEENKAYEICGKIIAPLMDSFFSSLAWDYSRETELKSIINIFMDSNTVKTRAFQSVLEEHFEYYLELGFKGDDEYVSSPIFKTCQRNLINIEDSVNKVWKKVKNNINLSEIDDYFKEYIPLEVFKTYSVELKNNLKKMKRFDIPLVKEWLNLRLDKDVSKSTRTRYLNNALEVYFNQTLRPSGNDLLKIKNIKTFVSDNLKEKMDAFLSADLIKRNKLEDANNILLKYGPNLKEIEHHLGQYLNIHGKIALKKYALRGNYFHPNYNALVDFKDRFNKLVEVK